MGTDLDRTVFTAAMDRLRDEEAAMAIIGSRTHPPAAFAYVEALAAAIAGHGVGVVSGNAVGTDQAAARGANRIDPGLVHLVLPWSSYERAAVRSGNRISEPPYPDWMAERAARIHPRWDRLGAGAQALHTRNIGLIEASGAVVAWPRPDGRGGTATGMAYARATDRALFDLRKAAVREALARWGGLPDDLLEPLRPRQRDLFGPPR